MAEGYSTNPLFKKLGLKENFNVALINPPNNYDKLIGELAKKLHFKNNTTNNLDFIHFFTNSILELEALLPLLKLQLKKDGIIWVSWYKKSSGRTTDLSDNIIRDTALAIGLVDVKVCAVNEDWSGLKLVFRLKDR